jgi:hypothetical protein
MKKYLLLFLFANIVAVANTQVIKGNISDKKSEQPIAFASIYFNGSFVGTQSDQDGNFELDISKNASMPLTISAIGYYSETLTIFTNNESLKISLTPKIIELNEVVVSAKSPSKNRKENLQVFRSSLLGMTANASKCKILNEDDISFSLYHDTLEAYALKPIMIENKALGYKITYYLDKFEYDKKSKTIFFYGNIIFNEDFSIEKSKKEIFDKRRKDAYLGSRMHFFRMLWTNELASAGFKVKSEDNQDINSKIIVYQNDNGKCLQKYSNEMEVLFHKNRSSIVFLKEKIFFDKNGYFDPMGIGWKGEMAKQRIADWLPYEYSIK